MLDVRVKRGAELSTDHNAWYAINKNYFVQRFTTNAGKKQFLIKNLLFCQV